LADQKEKPRVFAREATGLVRSMSAFDASAINWTGETLATGLLTFFAFAFLFPGANLGLAMLITVIAFIPLSVTYAMSVASMPRAGGDYVFISRTLHPSLGFMLVLSLNVWFSFYSGAFANWIFTIGLAPTFSVVGNILHSSSILSLSSMMTEPLVATVGGSILIVVTALIAIFSTKLTARLVGILIIIGTISVIAIAAIFLSSTNQQFHSAFNAYSSSYTNSSDYYNTIISNAQKAGFSQSGFSWGDTIAMLPFGAYIFLYVSEMQAAGGEIRNAKKTAYYAALLTMVIGGGAAIFATVAFSHAMPPIFYNSVSYAYYTPGTGYVLPVQPTYNFLASLLTNNIGVLWLLNIGFITTNIALLLMFYLFTPRYFLAASFDRIMPEKLSSVSERFHTPYLAILVAMVLALITLPIYSYYASLLTTLSAVLGELLFGYLIFGIATVFFPFSKRTKPIYQNSTIRKSIGGIPLITILGVLNCAFLIYLGYVLIVNSSYGVNSSVSLIAVISIAVAAPVWYFAKRAYMKSRQIDLDLVFNEIPPE
jgi:APA family basic amino acid/polyamine antiporter